MPPRRMIRSKHLALPPVAAANAANVAHTFQKEPTSNAIAGREVVAEQSGAPSAHAARTKSAQQQPQQHQQQTQNLFLLKPMVDAMVETFAELTSARYTLDEVATAVAQCMTDTPIAFAIPLESGYVIRRREGADAALRFSLDMTEPCGDQVSEPNLNRDYVAAIDHLGELKTRLEKADDDDDDDFDDSEREALLDQYLSQLVTEPSATTKQARLSSIRHSYSNDGGASSQFLLANECYFAEDDANNAAVSGFQWEHTWANGAPVIRCSDSFVIGAAKGRSAAAKADLVKVLLHVFGTFGAPLLSSPSPTTTMAIECCIIARRLARTKVSVAMLRRRIEAMVVERCGTHMPTLDQLFRNIRSLTKRIKHRVAKLCWHVLVTVAKHDVAEYTRIIASLLCDWIDECHQRQRGAVMMQDKK
jgi:hypothetical protein